MLAHWKIALDRLATCQVQQQQQTALAHLSRSCPPPRILCGQRKPSAAGTYRSGSSKTQSTVLLGDLNARQRNALSVQPQWLLPSQR
jgi:hypothetical protein